MSVIFEVLNPARNIERMKFVFEEKNKILTMDTSIYKNKKSKIYFSGIRNDSINLIDKYDIRLFKDLFHEKWRCVSDL